VEVEKETRRQKTYYEATMVKFIEEYLKIELEEKE